MLAGTGANGNFMELMAMFPGIKTLQCPIDPCTAKVSQPVPWHFSGLLEAATPTCSGS